MQQILATVRSGPTDPFRVGQWLVDPWANEIWCGKTREKLQPKVMELLVFLSSNAPRPVSREEIIEIVWNGLFVSDDAVTNAIVKLRQALGDNGNERQYIETIPKVGYRLVAQIKDVGPQEFAQAAAEQGAGLQKIPGLTALGIAAAIAVLLVLASNYRYATPTYPQARFSFVSDFPGSESMPAPSPDGARMALVWTSQQTKDMEESDIYVLSMKTGELTQLTDSAERDTNPIWSPDGSQIAFVRFAGMRCEIFLISPDGGIEQFLHRCGSGPMRLGHSVIDWSADGRWIVYVDSGADNRMFHISKFSLSTGEIKQLTQPTGKILGDISPIFSPTSDRIAFTRYMPTGDKEVFVVGSDGGVLRQLTFDETNLQGLSWTADGRSILYAAGRIDKSVLFRVDAAGGGSEQIPLSAQGIYDIHRAPDGKFYAALQRTSRVEAKMVSIEDMTSAARAVDPTSNNVTWPKYSPDGKKVAFITTRMGKHELQYAYLDSGGALDGSGPVSVFEIGENPVYSTYSWSPNSDKLIISRAEDEKITMYIAELTTGHLTRLFSSEFTNFSPILTRDGQHIIYSSRRNGNWQLRKYTLESGTDRLFVRGGGFRPQESRDGQWIYYYRYDSPGGIWRTSNRGEATALVLEEPYAIKNWFRWQNWQLDDDGIYIVTPGGNGAQFSFFDFESKRLSKLHRLTDRRVEGISVSPDGKTLVYAPLPHIESDLIEISVSGL